MRIEVNNSRVVEITAYEDNSLNVDIIDKNGDLDYFYEIKESDLVTLLNHFEYENNISKKID